MTLFWHNHFATSYAKVAGATTALDGARYMAGQVEMLRNQALGNYEELLVEIAKDTAMLIWLDGRLNTRLLDDFIGARCPADAAVQPRLLTTELMLVRVARYECIFVEHQAELARRRARIEVAQDHHRQARFPCEIADEELAFIARGRNQPPSSRRRTPRDQDKDARE